MIHQAAMKSGQTRRKALLDAGGRTAYSHSWYAPAQNGYGGTAFQDPWAFEHVDYLESRIGTAVKVSRGEIVRRRSRRIGRLPNARIESDGASRTLTASAVVRSGARKSAHPSPRTNGV
jgi:hypothetical protein